MITGNIYSKMKKSKVIMSNIVLLILLIIIFFSIILTNINYYTTNNTKNYLIKINNEEISQEAFMQYYFLKNPHENNIKNINKPFKNNKYYNLKLFKQTLRNIINETLLTQYTNYLGITIDDSYIQKYIFDQSYFKINNKFNILKYKNILEKFKISSNEYIENVKKYLKIQTLINIIYNTIPIFKTENDHIIKLLNQGRIIKKSIINTKNFINKKIIKPKDIKNYYLNHKKNFISQEKFKINYFLINMNNIKINYSKQDVIKQYQNNILKYCIPEKIKFNIIKSTNKQEIETILNNLNKNIPFSVIKNNFKNKNYSTLKEENKWISINSSSSILQKSKISKTNQRSKIFKLNNDFVLTKITDIKPKIIQPLSMVYNIVKKDVIYKKQKKEYFSIIKKTSTIHNYTLLNQIAKNNNAHIYQNPWLTKQQIIKKFKIIKPLKHILSRSNVFNSQKMLKHYPITVVMKKNCTYVIWIHKYQQSKLKKLSNILKKEIANILNHKNKTMQIKLLAKKIINELNNNSQNLITKIKLQFGKNETIFRSNNSKLAKKLFKISCPKKCKKQFFYFINSHNQLFIIQFFDVIYLNPSEKNKEIKRNILTTYRLNIINTILNNLYQNASISYGTEFPSQF